MSNETSVIISDAWAAKVDADARKSLAQRIDRLERMESARLGIPLQLADHPADHVRSEESDQSHDNVL